MRTLFARLIAIILIPTTLWSPVAFAVDVQLARSLQFRTLNDQSRESVGILRAGSRIAIPDQFRLNNSSGVFDPELTLNNWLKNAGRTGYAQPDHGEGLVGKAAGAIDYYYPVKILEAAPGSTMPSFKGKTYFLALRLVSRQSDALKTTADAVPEEASDASRSEAYGCEDGRCRSKGQSSQFHRLVSELQPVLSRAKAQLVRTERRTAHDMRKVRETFRLNCGFSLDQFLPYIQREASAAGIPTATLLAMMVQESSGRCYATGTNGDGSQDAGLFGISSNGRLRRCSGGEMSWLRAASPSQLAAGPQCLDNPVVNLKAAVSILSAKMKALVRMGFFGSTHARFARALYGGCLAHGGFGL